MELQRAKEYWRGDGRILGDDDFVNQVLQAAAETLTRREALKRQGLDLQRLVTEVCRTLSVDPEDLQKKGRASSLSYAKGVICYLGYSRLGLAGKEPARYFNMSQPSVFQAIQRGDRFQGKQA